MSSEMEGESTTLATSDTMINSAITHELEALLDDRRLMLSNSEWFISNGGPYKLEIQTKLSLRKKEIRSSLKNEWLKLNNSKTSQQFDLWLGTIISNIIS
jgi:hypothetical protein